MGFLCFRCVQATERGLLELSKCSEPTCASLGFCNWKKGMEKFQGHQDSSTHRFGISQQKSKSVGAALSAELDSEQKKARTCLRAMVSSCKYLSRQGLAMRGHFSDEGNFVQLLKVRSHEIPYLSKWMEKSQHFITPTAKNEKMQLFSHEILRKISGTLNSSFLITFSVIVDGTQDISGVEQQSICVRYIGDDFQAAETTGEPI